MQSPYVGRSIAVVVIFGLCRLDPTFALFWRKASPKNRRSRFPFQPSTPRWPLPRASKPQFLPAAAFWWIQAVFDTSGSFYRDFRVPQAATSLTSDEAWSMGHGHCRDRKRDLRCV